MAFQPNYQWAAGHNQAGSLAIVEDDVPQYQGQPMVVQGRGAFDPGTQRVRADFTRYTTGVIRFAWTIGVMSEEQYDYIQDTYTTGGNSHSGLMTVRTLNDFDTFANYNCIMWLPKRPELTRRRNAFENVILQFIDAVAL